jgi:hypothetical protein
MESHSEELRIHCSEAAALLIMEQDPNVSLDFRGQTVIKGKGTMPTYWVEQLQSEKGCISESQPAAGGSCQRPPPELFRCVTSVAFSSAGVIGSAQNSCNDDNQH